MDDMQHFHEEQDAWFSRADRFDGFDRGDVEPAPPPSAFDGEWEDIPY